MDLAVPQHKYEEGQIYEVFVSEILNMICVTKCRARMSTCVENLG